MIKRGLKIPVFILLTALSLILGACSNSNDEAGEKKENTKSNESTHGAHSNMNHAGSREVPKGLKEADNPKYEVGTQAMIESDHMGGMKGAEATIVGAYDTTVYTISYTPTDGGKKVEKHKWVIHEEIQDAGDEPFKPGSEVKINAEHMEGMDGVTAEIDSSEATTVYMVDFTTTDGEEVTNHKWVTESELSPTK